ncbi:MAG: hypothetical protein ABT02_00455 [Comamonadaceae bacterium SCN 68-20]|jgi:hypothetical protein|nr:MAG: hypothetical protein ABT02_00455 [Comamonadaceae bacterium SCN 68-20]OJX08481.1 MAG: hypothetical protein BGO75_18515 [Burkholderiales bacterium 68-20]UJB66508.1 hypothetical protein YS110_17970 [Acidovorax sp. YS12]
MTNKELIEIIDRATDAFHGDLSELESAIGMLMLGRHYGWRVLMLMHSQATIRKYLKILGIQNLRDVLPEVGVLAGRSRAWRLVQGTSNFWRVVRGQVANVRSARVDGPAGTPPGDGQRQQ